MPSSAILTTLRDRVEAYLVDSTNAIWATGTIDEGLRLALHEYSQSRPQRAIGTVTLSTAAREVALSGLTGLIGVERVWFPYTAADPEYPPEWVLWKVFDNAGAFTLFLDVVEDPAANEVARVFYRKLQTLNGLDSATATTFAVEDDSLLVVGAAGHCCFARATDLAETAGVSAVSTPNLAAIGSRMLKSFRQQLGMQWRVNI